jgi:hydroxypyruvate isomerase
MAGLTTHGAGRAAYVSNLKMAARWAAAQGVDVLIEPINTRDIPGYFLNCTSQARHVLAEVGEPNLGLQFDLYHRHVMEGDVAGALQEFGNLARHYQCAGPPDRGEPDAGDLDYREIFRAIDASGYGGWIGCEYKPRGETQAGLVWRERCGVAAP